MRALSIIILLLLMSCSSDKELKITELNDYYQSAGVEQYLLSEIPDWVNFFESGYCKRSRSIKFFDIQKVIQSLDVTYEQAVQLQYAFNERLRELTQGQDLIKQGFKDYQFLFYDVHKQVIGGKQEYRIPEYDTIIVFWGDSNWSNPNFIRLIESRSQENILPVFVSGCLSANEVRAELDKNRLAPAAEYIIPQELFAASQTGYYLKLKELVKAKKIELYIPKGFSHNIFGAVDVIKEY